MLRLVVVVLGLALAGPVLAQDRAQSLADIRAELQKLASDLQSLRSELVSGGAPALQAAGGGSALERMDAMEAAMTQLTAQTEELQNRINRVVADGTNRIGDLEFRLVELEGGDVSNLPITATLGQPGSAVPAPAAPAPAAPAPDAAAAPVVDTAGASMAVNEQADFDRAQEVLGQGDFRRAADLFAAFAQSYPGGPLTVTALFQRAEALRQLGDTKGQAQSYLDAYNADPEGPRAPEALLALGRSLADLGQMSEACVMLSEVGARFPRSQAAADAANTMQGLQCQ